MREEAWLWEKVEEDPPGREKKNEAKEGLEKSKGDGEADGRRSWQKEGTVENEG